MQCMWKQQSAADAIITHPLALFPSVHAATWPTYGTEHLQPLRVQLVQGGKLSHGTRDAHFPSVPSLPIPLHPVPSRPPPPSPGLKDYLSSTPR